MNLGRYPLVTHLGAGDGILQSGLAVGLLDRYEEIAFPCYPQYEATFKSIFINHPRISIYTVEIIQDEDWGSPRDSTYDAAISAAEMAGRPHIRAGVYAGRGIGWDFSKSFYEHVNLPYEYRWRRCPIKDAAKVCAQSDWSFSGRKKFVHDDDSRGFNLRVVSAYRQPGFESSYRQPEFEMAFRPPRDLVSDSILRYAYMINTADEIHCIDSAFFHLVDSLDPVGKLYLHCYARWPRGRDFRYENRFSWNYIF
jgi:hypothetical protein